MIHLLMFFCNSNLTGSGCGKKGGEYKTFMCFFSSDMKLHLQSTDYGKLLSSSEEDLTVSLVDSKLRENLVTEFSCLRSNALPPLSTFLDYITYVTTLHANL